MGSLEWGGRIKRGDLAASAQRPIREQSVTRLTQNAKTPAPYGLRGFIALVPTPRVYFQTYHDKSGLLGAYRGHAEANSL